MRHKAQPKPGQAYPPTQSDRRDHDSLARPGLNPFDELDTDWRAECQRHRRSTIVARWAREEPALATACQLADVVPATWPERGPIVEALVRLASGGDKLAVKALLQLLRPGLVRIVREMGPALGGTRTAGREVLSLAFLYLRRVSTSNVRCDPAWYVLRSIKRDLVVDQRKLRTRPDRLTPVALIDCVPQRTSAAPSAEEAAFAGSLVRASLADAVQRRDVSDEAAQIVWLRAEGHSLTAAAEAVGMSSSRARRLHTRALAVLRRDLADAGRPSGRADRAESIPRTFLGTSRP